MKLHRYRHWLGYVHLAHLVVAMCLVCLVAGAPWAASAATVTLPNNTATPPPASTGLRFATWASVISIVPLGVTNILSFAYSRGAWRGFCAGAAIPSTLLGGISFVSMHFFAVSVVAEGSSGNDIVTGVEELIQVTHQQATGVMLLTSILGGLIGASLFWIARPPLPREGAARFRRSQWRRLAAVLAAFGVTLWIVRLLPERRQFLATLILGYLVLPVLAIAGTSCAGRRVKAACLGMAPTWLALPNTSYQVMLIISMEDGVSADGFSTPYQLALLAFAASGLANLWLVTSQRKSHAQHRRLNSLSTCVRRRATLFPQPTSCCDGGP